MSQRNPMNERYQDENRGGKTRKSSASAKPKAARAATVRAPREKTAKEKKAEARERERAAMKKAEALESITPQSRYENTDEYKRLRRIWWVALGSAIVCTAVSFIVQSRLGEDFQALSMGLMIAAYALIIIAFYVDLGKIRKGRKMFNARQVTGKSKAARKEQKKARAEARAQEKEAAEKFEAAKAEEEAKKEQGFFGRFRKKSEPATDSEAEATEAEATEAESK